MRSEGKKECEFSKGKLKHSLRKGRQAYKGRENGEEAVVKRS